MIRYCNTCILPNTRPNLVIGEDGICNACRNHKEKAKIDWSSREQAFRVLVSESKARSRGYDCLIPVSGGKDSTWQTVKCLEYGLNPLTVTWKTPARTKIGQKNLDNLVSLGADHIDYQVNPKVEKKFIYLALAGKGIPALPMHLAIYNISLKVALRFDIPLIVWGENPAIEYGGGEKDEKYAEMNEGWLKRFGVTGGATALDFVSGHLSKAELTPYFGPADDELKRKGVRAIFLGDYFEWSPEIAFQTASKHGFQAAVKERTGYYKYADIDDEFISVHHWLKWYKFGFTRLWDNLSLEIRNGRMDREQALSIVAGRGDETPRKDIHKLCAFLEISEARFFEIIQPFRNRDIWVKHNNAWMIEGFPLPNWNWR